MKVRYLSLPVEYPLMVRTNKDLLKALGDKLYRALFPNQINVRHATMTGAASNNQSVRLR